MTVSIGLGRVGSQKMDPWITLGRARAAEFSYYSTIRRNETAKRIISKAEIDGDGICDVIFGSNGYHITVTCRYWSTINKQFRP